ncbi:MAG: T9SS type A sorting domain-containing protein, partial [Bacteroidales bacterium]|nr:T9SS type A sorting domain-containing protein [Bacteroidales bacterium]
RTAIEILEKQQIFLSSNLVKDILTLTLPTDNNEIKIFDLQGKLLLQQNVGFSAEINVSMLSVGTYVLVVNGESYKFVKE